MNEKLKKIINLMEFSVYPLTKIHTLRIEYKVSNNVTLRINSKSANLYKDPFGPNHLDIFTNSEVDSLVQHYASYDFKDLDQVYTDLEECIKRISSKESRIESLKKQEEEIKNRILRIEHEN